MISYSFQTYRVVLERLYPLCSHAPSVPAWHCTELLPRKTFCQSLRVRADPSFGMHGPHTSNLSLEPPGRSPATVLSESGAQPWPRVNTAWGALVKTTQLFSWLRGHRSVNLQVASVHFCHTSPKSLLPSPCTRLLLRTACFTGPPTETSVSETRKPRPRKVEDAPKSPC